ncbi:hypothetical protein GCM10022245_28830 [Streptomyces mayteni]
MPTVDWRTRWQAADEKDLAADWLGEFRCVNADQLPEPVDTITVACAIAESASALPVALGTEWSLYTPQQAADVASAVFSQIEAAAQALRALSGALSRIIDRGDTQLPPPDANTLPPAGPATATARLQAAADDIEQLLDRYAHSCVNELDAIPTTVVLPADAHDTVAAVAACMGEAATFIWHHEPGAYDPDTDGGFGCGCAVEVTHDGETWNFTRGDCCWRLLRLGGGEPTPDGGRIYSSRDGSSWMDLDVSEATAYPAHLVEEIWASLEAASVKSRALSGTT